MKCNWAALPFIASLSALLIAGHLHINGTPKEKMESIGMLASGFICFSIGCIAQNAKSMKMQGS
jgi:hypothetical protein